MNYNKCIKEAKKTYKPQKDTKTYTIMTPKKNGHQFPPLIIVKDKQIIKSAYESAK